MEIKNLKITLVNGLTYESEIYSVDKQVKPAVIEITRPKSGISLCITLKDPCWYDAGFGLREHCNGAKLQLLLSEKDADIFISLLDVQIPSFKFNITDIESVAIEPFENNYKMTMISPVTYDLEGGGGTCITTINIELSSKELEQLTQYIKLSLI